MPQRVVFHPPSSKFLRGHRYGRHHSRRSVLSPSRHHPGLPQPFPHRLGLPGSVPFSPKLNATTGPGPGGTRSTETTRYRPQTVTTWCTIDRTQLLESKKRNTSSRRKFREALPPRRIATFQNAEWRTYRGTGDDIDTIPYPHASRVSLRYGAVPLALCRRHRSR